MYRRISSIRQPVTWLMALALLSLTAAPVAAQLPDFNELVEQNKAAVVNISATGKSEPQSAIPNSPGDQEVPEFFRRFFEQMPKQRPSPRSGSTGSGFIVDADGYIVTNAHVVAEAENITVRLNDRRELPAQLIGADERSDVAVLKVEATNLPTVKLGDSDALKVGQWVVAIGSPFGFDYSVTQGVVSALSRSLPDGTYVPFIQTDVAVNPGNSGGPLFDLEGNVVGVNSQIYSRSGGYMGLSFAIPINVAKQVADQLKTQGHVQRGWLGVAIQDVDQKLAQAFGLDKPKGALVSQVTPNSPADKGGVQTGDVIIGFNDNPIARSGALPPLVGATEVGSKVSLEVLRGGKLRTLKVTLGQLEDRQAALTPNASQKGRLGLALADLNADQREKLGADERGVLVRGVTPGSAAAAAGIRPDDVILEFDRQDVKSASQLAELIEKAPAGEPSVVLVMRDERTLFVPIVTSDEDVS